MTFKSLLKKVGVSSFVFGLLLTIAALPSASQVNTELYDYGDAPSITFPTTRFLFSGEFGIAHQANELIWLGQEVTYEAQANTIDNDQKDDAEYTFGVDASGSPFFEVEVSANSASDVPDFAYLNVLVDSEGTCSRPDSLGWSQPSNHVVVDQEFDVSRGQTLLVRVPAKLFVDTRNHWLRISVTESPLSYLDSNKPNWVGDGFAYWTGETEDHCQDIQDPTLGVIPTEPACDCGLVEMSGGSVEILPDNLPDSVKLAFTEANGIGFVFSEKTKQVLNYPPDVFDQNLYASGNDLIGKEVNSYFLHFDPNTSRSGNVINASGSITVSKCEMIVGLIITDAGLDATDSTFDPGVDYPTNLASRGLETGSGNTSDLISITSSRTVDFNFNATTVLDQVRIITMKIDDCEC